MLWQLLASVFIPGFIINRTVEAATWTLKKLSDKGKISNANAIKWIPVVLGICTIPFIVKPIDHSVTKLLDLTTRKLYTV